MPSIFHQIEEVGAVLNLNLNFMGSPKMLLLLTFDNVFMEKNRFKVKRRKLLFHPLFSVQISEIWLEFYLVIIVHFLNRILNRFKTI